MSQHIPETDKNAKQTSAKESQGQHLALRAGLFTALLVLVFGLAFYFVFNPAALSGLGNYLNDLVASSGPWGWLIIIGMMIAHSFVPIPAEFVAVASGMSYDVLLGSLLVWIGAMLGALLAFGLARWLGEPFVEKFLNPRHRAALNKWKSDQGVPTLLISRLIPLISFNLINYAAGLTGVPLWTFIWTTAIGIIPITIISVFVGASMSELPIQWIIALSAIGIALIVAVHLWFRQRRNNHSDTTE